MHVDAPEPRRVQHRLRQDPPVGDHHGGVQVQGRERRLGSGVAQGPRRAHLDTGGLGGGLYRGRTLALAAAGRTRRLGIDADHVVTGVAQGLQHRNREVGTAEEREAEARIGGLRHAACSRERCFFALTIFFMIMLRLSAEMRSTNSTPSIWSISCCRQTASRPSPSISCLAPSRSR